MEFLVLTTCVYANWQMYQGDLRNSGRATTSGYFPTNTLNITRYDIGTDFQPLVDDIDKDGNNEIIIFYNDSLFVLNKFLDTLNSTKVGAILGQPALFNFDDDPEIEVIFNARYGQEQHFFAYEMRNNQFVQEFNISLPFDANRSGIKCLNLDGINSCVFKDKKNYVHIIDLDNRRDDFYNTSSNTEIRYSIPAIGDVDGDGNQEAVFWFNEDGVRGYGFLVFDLTERRPDPVFNNKGIVDNIFEPYIEENGIEQYENLILKGHPVLIDIDNDGKMEIAVTVVYDDIFTGRVTQDWFTDMIIYNHTGAKRYTTCNGNCNYGGSARIIFHGSNPFIMDYNGDNVDEICYMTEVREYVHYMALKCQNGNEGYQKFVSYSTYTKSAMAADMDNDGLIDVITPDGIYTQNGIPLIEYSFYRAPIERMPENSPIAVDMDSNGGLDLIWSQGIKTVVLLDGRNYTSDLSVSNDDVYFSKFNKTHMNVTAIIRNFGEVESNVKVSFYSSEDRVDKIVNVRRNQNSTVSVLLSPNENEHIFLYVDPNNEITETDDSNNFAFKEFMGLPYVYVSSVNEYYESELKKYIESNLISGSYTNNEKIADIKVYIGKYNTFNRFLKTNELGYDNGGITFNEQYALNPYSGLVASFKDNENSKIEIMVVGNEVDGEIAAVKEFIKNQAKFLSGESASFIGDDNLDAIKIYDYLHTSQNSGYYKTFSLQFNRLVANALYDNMILEIGHNVTTLNGINLRLRNIKPDFSSDYISFLSSSLDTETPIVMSGGIFSDLNTFSDLGTELANEGHDVWLMEMNGGSQIECGTCIDYSYEDQVKYFWPALLAGAIEYSGKNRVNYIGHSNGCRSALSSLNLYSNGKEGAGYIFNINSGSHDVLVDLPDKPVDKFFGIACPAVLNGDSTFIDTARKEVIPIVDRQMGELVMSEITEKHVTMLDYGSRALLHTQVISPMDPAFGGKIVFLSSVFTGSNRISRSLLSHYINLSLNTSSTMDLSGVNVNELHLYHGKLFPFVEHDILVPLSDQEYILNGVDAQVEKSNIIRLSDHSSIKNKASVETNIKEELK